MKAANIFHPVLRLIIIPLLVFSLVQPPWQIYAQEGASPEAYEKYSKEELAQMLAPIALYPDALLAQILMASTYPIEVVEADRWLKRNPGLSDEALDGALLGQDWDPSVKAMCHFPSIMALMSERITETTNLGNAFLAQEDEVMDMVQELRSKAYAQGNLATNAQQKVIVEKQTIIIEPIDPRYYYVPFYDPFYIYGPWWYPAFPPFYWGPPGVRIGIGISYWPVFYFGFPFLTWSYFDWHHHYIHIVVRQRPRYVRQDFWFAKSGRWHHLPRHRRGVAYRDKFTARKYGQYPYRSREFRRDTRGFPERTDRVRRGEVRRQTERSGQAPERIERDRQERTRIEQDRRERTRIESELRERKESERRQSQDVTSSKRIIQRAEPRQQSQQQIQRDKDMRIQKAPERGRDNVFNRVDEGGQAHRSSERGRISREGRGYDTRGRGQSGQGDRGLRDNRGLNRR